MIEEHHIDRRAFQLIAYNTASDPDGLLSTKQLAEWLGISTQWLEIGRVRGYGPAFIALSPRRIRYRRAAVLEWLHERQKAAIAKLAKRRAARQRAKRTRLNDPREAAE